MQDPLEYRLPGKQRPEEYPPRQEDESIREHLGRLDGEELIAAFRNPEFGRDEPELGWADAGQEGYERTRAGIMADMVQDGLLNEARENPRTVEGRVQYDGPYDAEHDGGYRGKYGENWENCAVAVNNLADAVMAAGRDMVEEGLTDGNATLIAEGRELMAYSCGLQQNILDDGRMTMELHLAERSIRWGLPDAEAQELEQALERMMETGRTDWPNPRTEAQDEHIRDRIALSLADQIRENSLEGNQNAVMHAWDQTQEWGDSASRERAGCVGLALQGAAARILDPADPEGPMGMTRQGLARRSGERVEAGPEWVEAGLERAKQVEEGVRAVCEAIRDNAENPEWDIARAERAAVAGMMEACRTMEGTQAWLDAAADGLEAGYNEGAEAGPDDLANQSSGLDDLADGLNRKAMEFFNEAVESLGGRMDGRNGPGEWSGLNGHETTRLRAALIIGQFQDRDTLESLVQRNREARHASRELMSI